MNVDVFAVCDAATDGNGKLNLLGAFDSIVGRLLPLVKQRCSVVARMCFSKEESGEHEVAVRFLNKDGQQIIRAMKAKFTVKIPNRRRTASINLVLNINRIKFEHFGEYTIAFSCDGEQRASLPLYVVREANVATRNRMDN